MIGDPSDVKMMWQGKNINMDTGSGFDEESFFGAGFDETMNYLERNRILTVADDLKTSKEYCSPEHLKEWADAKRKYFYN